MPYPIEQKLVIAVASSALFNVSLFLFANEDDVKSALESGIAAGMS